MQHKDMLSLPRALPGRPLLGSESAQYHEPADASCEDSGTFCVLGAGLCRRQKML